MKKCLFILKRREDYNANKHSQIGLSTGLYNSAKFVSDNLEGSKLVVVVDNNDIDREVTLFNPTHVIIEALWVTPTKFNELQKLHPNVIWIVRLHSEMPFMAGEGIAMNWIGEYSKFINVMIACNAPRMLDEVKIFVEASGGNRDKVIYLPNFYPQTYKTKQFIKNKDFIDIGCFGAIRPLKNHLVQALAALKFARFYGKKLRFHINAGRIEMNGTPTVQNLQFMFAHLYDEGHRLINHEWTPREEFLELCGSMDIGMQVSFSETFNIVGADFISMGVPLIGSNEIPWIHDDWSVDPTSSLDIFDKLVLTYNHPDINVSLNQFKLLVYTNDVKKIWNNFIRG